MAKITKLKWNVDIEVDVNMVEDGFDLDADKLKEAILKEMLGFALPREVEVTIKRQPKGSVIKIIQGYMPDVMGVLKKYRISTDY